MESLDSQCVHSGSTPDNATTAARIYDYALRSYDEEQLGDDISHFEMLIPSERVPDLDECLKRMMAIPHERRTESIPSIVDKVVSSHKKKIEYLSVYRKRVRGEPVDDKVIASYIISQRL